MCKFACAAAGAWWVKVEVTDEARGQVVREAFLGRRRGDWRGMLLHVPAGGRALAVWVVTPNGWAWGAGGTGAGVARGEAAAAAVAGGCGKWAGCLAEIGRGWRGGCGWCWGRRRAGREEAPPYDVWVGCSIAGARRSGRRWQRRGAVAVEVVIVGEVMAASERSVAEQWVRPERVSCVAALAGFERRPGTWLVVLAAGDVLAAQAVGCFARAIRAAPDKPGFYADADWLVAGLRAAPLFKPDADPWLARSSLLGVGARAVHPDRAADAGLDGFGHVPFVLTHVAGARLAPVPAPAVPPGRLPKVSIVVPTVLPGAARAAVPARCAGLHGFTRISRCCWRSPDATRGIGRSRATWRPAARLKLVRVLDLEMAVFNYAAVNNAAVRAADGTLILLLNDDVRPVRGDWLARMVAATQAPAPLRADIVGARLLYGHGRVQHGGVILGLAHLCEHAFRVDGARRWRAARGWRCWTGGSPR